MRLTPLDLLLSGTALSSTALSRTALSDSVLPDSAFCDRRRILVVFVAVLLIPAIAGASEPTLDFNRDIRSILFGKCVTCHGPDEEERAADLRLDTAEGAHEDLGGYAAVMPGDPDASEVILRVTSDDEDMLMPPPGKGEKLSPEEVAILRRWINEGGQYAKHWSYEIPIRSDLPPVSDKSWPTNPIDHFSLARLEAKGLVPSKRADRLTLARRVAIDLTGLPPTWKEAQAFANDEREDAYEIYVDSLLAKPAFGERWARVWLDLARYADSAGYADDPPRTIWAYRDYVIKAINSNLPFDQFTIEQIAGDLLPNPTEQQLIATAFHRNTLTNNEGGTNDEEFRNVAVVDRVNTTMAVWMGTTMACAQCHTHKYDPITHEEYFKFFAFFNSSEDADRRNESPLIEIWSDDQKRRKAALTQEIKELESQLSKPSEAIDQQRDAWLAQFTSPPEWTIADAKPVGAKRELKVGEDGWIEAVGDSAATDTYEVKIPTQNAAVTGLRLETSTSQKRNFVVSQIRASWTPSTPTPIQARYVRVENPGKSRFLHLAEIEIFHGDDNIATKGKASQSSTYADAIASRVNDGNTNGDYHKGSVQHTSGEANPWVEIDLGEPSAIDRLVIWNRTDGGKSVIERLSGFKIELLDENRKPVWRQQPEGPATAKHAASLSGVRKLKLSHASADHEQSGFPAASVLRPELNAKSGWAVAPQVGRPHELTLSLDAAIPATEGDIKLSIAQESEHANHLLDHFRLSVSTDEHLTRWATLPNDMRKIVAKDSGTWNEKQIARVRRYYREIAPALQPQRDALKSARDKLSKMKPMTTVPVMKELPENKRRVTKIQLRGNYQSTGDTVSQGTPEVFHAVAHADNPSRLDLAEWLVSDENPLTPRVIVNRHWEQLFGIGIVETSEEFGSQGELPSHPLLLDWLAVDFRENGWDVKRLIKQMVLSSTYCQSSETSAKSVAADPANRLLARGPRFRISAEMVRDQALFVSGLLSDKRYGPPVKPPQPELGLKAAFGSATDWQTSQGEDRYRRGLYTTWRRSSPYPSMAQFDAPNREVCTVRRIRTNTPLQALVTLNDPVYVEAAQAFARRIIAASESDRERISFALRTSLIREPNAAETDRLLALVEDVRGTYASSTEDAVTMATDPIGDLPDGADPVEHATWTVVANVILNLDEMLMKP